MPVLADLANWPRWAEFMITFHRPPSLTETAFKEQTGLVDIELAPLKEILETGRSGSTPRSA
ncbi:hypothetical protein [Streptomyces naphthomycinicus]|uniref:hypothetical protein n=1 Tax=Streptomyces naphthomycinicus TaxID=2872625 RepID=UPI001CED7F04|nr:hypothetical protein [Streptomyces sp. TML10]